MLRFTQKRYRSCYLGTCDKGQFKCKYDGSKYHSKNPCIPEYWVNDGIEDCIDGEDERTSPGELIIPTWHCNVFHKTIFFFLNSSSFFKSLFLTKIQIMMMYLTPSRSTKFIVE